MGLRTVGAGGCSSALCRDGSPAVAGRGELPFALGQRGEVTQTGTADSRWDIVDLGPRWVAANILAGSQQVCAMRKKKKGAKTQLLSTRLGSDCGCLQSEGGISAQRNPKHLESKALI